MNCRCNTIPWFNNERSVFCPVFLEYLVFLYTICIDHDELQHLYCRPSTPLVPGSADWPTGAAACQSPAGGEVPFLESYRMLFRSDSCALFPLFNVIWPELLSGIRIKDQSILICRCQGSTCCSVACLHHVYTKSVCRFEKALSLTAPGTFCSPWWRSQGAKPRWNRSVYDTVDGRNPAPVDR